MPARRLLQLTLTVGLLLLSAAAGAHARSLSHSSWTWSGTTAQLQVRFKQLTMAETIVGPGLEGGAIGPRELANMRRFARSRVLAGVGVSQGGTPCELSLEPGPARIVGDLLIVDGSCRCPEDVAQSGARISVDLFPDFGVSHTHLAVVRLGQEQKEAALGRLQPELVLSGAREAAPVAGSWLTFLRTGVVHILVGYDHLVFLLMLLLIGWLRSRNQRDMLRDLAWMASAFTVGHSLTLALAATGLVRPNGPTVELLIALSIIVLTLESLIVLEQGSRRAHTIAAAILLAIPAAALAGVINHPVLALLGLALFSMAYLEWARHQAQRAADEPRPLALRCGVTCAFGLIHGFGFAGVLLDTKLSGGALVSALLSFNVGVELGQLVVLAFAALLLWKIRATRWRRLTVQLGAALTFFLACYWLGLRALA